MSTAEAAFGSGVVYTETIVHSPPEAFLAEAPYQIAIVELDAAGRITARIHGEAVAIGERVDFLEFRSGIPFFTKHQ